MYKKKPKPIFTKEQVYLMAVFKNRNIKINTFARVMSQIKHNSITMEALSSEEALLFELISGQDITLSFKRLVEMQDEFKKLIEDINKPHEIKSLQGRVVRGK